MHDMPNRGYDKSLRHASAIVRKKVYGPRDRLAQQLDTACAISAIEIIHVIFTRRLNVMQLAVRGRVSRSRKCRKQTRRVHHTTSYLSEKTLHFATSCFVQIHLCKFKFQINNLMSVDICKVIGGRRQIFCI